MIQISFKEFDRLVALGCISFTDLSGQDYVVVGSETLRATITAEEVQNGYQTTTATSIIN